MATTQALQTLNDDLRKIMDQTKNAQGAVQNLRSAKKEAEIAKKRRETLDTMKTLQDGMAKLQGEMTQQCQQLEKALGESEGQGQDRRTASGKPIGLIEARKLSPEQQEALYELKASRMGAMQAQNQALKREVMLNQKKKQMLDARYLATQAYTGSETLKAAHALEAKLRGANLKIKGLEDELRKSQQMTLHYRQLHENGQRESEGNQTAAASSGQQGQSKATQPPKIKPAPLKEQSFIGPNTNINDVVRKNECLLEENEIQKREIQRLKRDNAELISIAKTASVDRDTVFARLGTSETARHDLQKRFHKLKHENSRLSKSYTQQAASWIEAKKQMQQTDTLDRYEQLYPVAPHGAGDRFREHYQTKNTSLPRQMMPVQSYGGTSHA